LLRAKTNDTLTYTELEKPKAFAKHFKARLIRRNPSKLLFTFPLSYHRAVLLLSVLVLSHSTIKVKKIQNEQSVRHLRLTLMVLGGRDEQTVKFFSPSPILIIKN